MCGWIARSTKLFLSIGYLLTFAVLVFCCLSLGCFLNRTKLFTRVIKAEDGETSPWASVDSLPILVALNEHFDICDSKEAAADPVERDNIVACTKMAKLLVESFVKSDPGAHRTRDLMSGAGIHHVSSPLGSVIQEFAPADEHPRPQTPSKGVATLVTALGSAQNEDEREDSLRALRQYTADHGDQELHSHLEQISPQFRTFILEQLSEQRQGAEDQDDNAATASSMADRLRILRSRLHSETNVAPQLQSRLAPPPDSKASTTHDNGSTTLGTSLSAEMSVSSRSTSDTSSQTLRARLTAAQQKRASSLVQPETSSTAGSRASALRARLQNLKQGMDSANA